MPDKSQPRFFFNFVVGSCFATVKRLLIENKVENRVFFLVKLKEKEIS